MNSMKRAMVIGAVIILTLLTPSILVGWGPKGTKSSPPSLSPA
ncbi:MAG: hypothetical protein ABSE40_18860 [Candidatus Sulfotelmatobacter sp.]